MFTYETFLTLTTPWALVHGIKIVLIIGGSIIAYLIAAYSSEKIIRRLIHSGVNVSPDAEKKREDTLITVFQSTLKVLIWTVAIMMSLSEIGIDIGPIIAAAGVVGLALGFGGQYLIKDVIAGLFIILENQYRVGDVVCIGDTCGLVERVNLRLTILRDLDGTVHHVSNGEIKIASNLSKVYSRVNLNIGVAYDTDIEKLITVINTVGKDLAEDPHWKSSLLTAPQFSRIDNFADSAIVVKILGDTAPLRQWDVTGELRKRLKIAFDQAGIEIPFPQVTMHHAAKEFSR